MEKGLYKRISDKEISFGMNKVASPTYTLIVADYENYEGEIQDGWYWFNTRQEALSFLGVTESEPEEPIIHPWHDITCSKQIILSYEQNLSLLSQYPEFGVYIKTNDINTVIENNYVYIYVNYILEDHLAILNGFGAIINDNI